MSDESFQAADAATDAAVPAPELEATAGSETAEQEAPQGDEPREPKTFTQEEYERGIQKERAKAERRIRREMEARQQEAQRPVHQPTFEEFNGDAAAFVEALADWKAEQKLAQREHYQHQQTVESSYEERVEQARDAKYHDYDEVVGKPFEQGGPAISDLMAEAIKLEANGVDVAYHLGTNVKESIRIAKLPPLQQAIEIGKLAVKLAGQAPPTKKVSSAPSPIRPVGANSTAPALNPLDPRSTKAMSTKQWIDARNAQEAAKRQSS